MDGFLILIGCILLGSDIVSASHIIARALTKE